MNEQPWIHDQNQPIEDYPSGQLKEWAKFLIDKIDDTGAGTYDMFRLDMIIMELRRRKMVANTDHPQPTDLPS